jgi:hypothetical protein
MASWRDELIEVVKTKAERDAEEQARHKKRVEEALATAEAAMALGIEGIRFTCEHLRGKAQPAELHEAADSIKVTLHELSLSLELLRDGAIIRITFGDSKPREFDFAKDRHIAPADVEEYVGRRSLELVRAGQKTHPW